jgi:hypothetical protein
LTVPPWARLAVLLVLAFGAGAMAGISYERHASHVQVSMTMPGNPAQLVDHLAQPLNLDSAQKAAIAQILARHQGAVDSAWRALQPKVGATLDSVHREIMSVLTPAQQKQFLSIARSMHAH